MDESRNPLNPVNQIDETNQINQINQKNQIPLAISWTFCENKKKLDLDSLDGIGFPCGWLNEEQALQ